MNSYLQQETKVLFGIELEFHTPPRPVDPEFLPDEVEPLARRYIRRDHTYLSLAQNLQSEGFRTAYNTVFSVDQPAYDYYAERVPSPTVPGAEQVDSTVYLKGALAGDEQDPQPYRCWVLKPEESMRPWLMGDYVDWVPAEINSPILSETEAESGFPNVNRAIKTLTDATEGQIHLNRGCGMHIHVSPVSGDMDRIAKRLVTLLTLIDKPLLLRLCAPHRMVRFVTAKTELSSIEKLVATKCTITDEMRDDVSPRIIKEKSMKQKLANLWASKDPFGPRMPFSRSRKGEPRSGLALRDHGRCEHKHSFEFRHAQSSFDQAFINNWILVCLALVKTTLLPAARFRRILDRLHRILHRGIFRSNRHAWADILSVFNEALQDVWNVKLDVEFWRSRLNSDRLVGGLDVDEKELIRLE